MKSEILLNSREKTANTLFRKIISKKRRLQRNHENRLPEVLFITSYPPRECGIATYSQDLYKALNNTFGSSFSLNVCALESGNADHSYPNEVKYILDTNDSLKYNKLVQVINDNKSIELILIQHEFGFFHDAGEDIFLKFLYGFSKPIVIVFHTVLPHPDKLLKIKILRISDACESIIVMTKNAMQILIEDYGVHSEKIVVIAHGTHLVPHLNKEVLKNKYGLTGRKVLSTFGLLNSGKSIETTLDSLPSIIKINPDVLFLIIGKTHPGVVKSEGEKYRNMLEAKVKTLKLQQHVKFINQYLPLSDLLEYLQLTDIYLFTSKDPHQAVSGTFSYAMSCGCPIISTPIPHAREVLQENTGIIIDFENSQQLTDAVNSLMSDELLRIAFSSNILQQIVPTAWENSAIAHAKLLQKIVGETNGEDTLTEYTKSILGQNKKISLQYHLPDINLEHIKKLTTEIGMIQFSKINQPDIDSGYTLDDNARALIAMCMHYELSGDNADLHYIKTYLNFIKYCQQPGGDFLNYVDKDNKFTSQNSVTNLSDANGRAIWALGYLISKSLLLPTSFITLAEEIIERAIPHIKTMYSTRTMAFVIKGLYYYNLEKKSSKNTSLIKTLANRLVQMYRHESEQHWQWYESYLTYGNSILPEAMLCAYMETGEPIYKDIAKTSFDFLLSLTFNESRIKVISNKTWLQKGSKAAAHGEQPIDVAYTIMAINRFQQVFKEVDYTKKISTAFNWFLGNNHLHQIIYNPCTGGCYDGLEENSVNLNQGAESTLSYLMARITMEKQPLFSRNIFELKN